MADINNVWVASIKHAAICKEYGLNHDKEWVERQISTLSARRLKHWRISKIRKYLLERFCHPEYVDAKIKEIETTRYQERVKTGKVGVL